MRYSIWRVCANGEAFCLTASGNISDRQAALEKARYLNERLESTDPDSEDRFVVQDESGREIRPAIRRKKPA